MPQITKMKIQKLEKHRLNQITSWKSTDENDYHRELCSPEPGNDRGEEKRGF